MKIWIGLILAVFSLNTHAQLKAYAEKYPSPLLIDDNAEALNLRLNLLAQAGQGSQVKVATFLFDFGHAVKVLSAQMCAAVSRGAQVELLVDAKAGEIPGIESLNNNSETAKSSEELFQYLANCGVKVYIHNSSRDYVSVLGHRLPNFFGRDIEPGSSIKPWQVLPRLNELKDIFLKELEPTLALLKVRKGLESVVEKVKKVLENYMLIPGHDYELLVREIQDIVNDPFWAELDIDEAKTLTRAIVTAVNTNPELKWVRSQIRVYNRLNHRKIFLVEDSDGTSCGIIGGRNLGDHYLTNSKDNFYDGDVFTCSTQQADIATYHAEIAVSFLELIHDQYDPAVDQDDVPVLAVPADKGYNFKRIRPETLAGLATRANGAVKGVQLTNFQTPKLLRANWAEQRDRIDRHLLVAITREQKEIYIETAYAEFNHSLRRALEKALERGVKVLLVTNGMFISDGASKFVRLWMAHWVETMKARYKNQFQVGYASLKGGHMIHFKGAGFRCQLDHEGKRWSTYIIGSHNFHPRSGYSDKENSVQWRGAESVGSCPRTDGDLIEKRMAFYRRNPILMGYDTLRLEVEEVSVNSENEELRNLALLINNAFFAEKSGRQSAFQVRLIRMLETLDEGGLRDLIGLFF